MGYIRICATWAERMWTPQNETFEPTQGTGYDKTLGRATDKFDACGAYDGDDAVPYPSDYEKWQNCVDFLEWYGIPMMPGFGMVIINDQTGTVYDKYYEILGITKEADGGPLCFNNAK